MCVHMTYLMLFLQNGFLHFSLLIRNTVDVYKMI